jgi:hypothetical protein
MRRSRRYRASPTPTITCIPDDPAFKRMVEATPSGMPHWSGTGPPGTVCAQCSFYGHDPQHPNSCHRYYVDRLQHGAAFPAETPSCLHFQPRPPALEGAEDLVEAGDEVEQGKQERSGE